MKAVVRTERIAIEGSREHTTALQWLYGAVAHHFGCCWPPQTLTVSEGQKSALLNGERPRCRPARGLLLASDICTYSGPQ
jgi:hypothetical protein